MSLPSRFILSLFLERAVGKTVDFKNFAVFFILFQSGLSGTCNRQSCLRYVELTF